MRPYSGHPPDPYTQSVHYPTPPNLPYKTRRTQRKTSQTLKTKTESTKNKKNEPTHKPKNICPTYGKDNKSTGVHGSVKVNSSNVY